MKRKHVLVTGATGFIGQHLVRALLDENYTVRAMKHGNNLLCFFKENEVEWWEADLRIPDDLKGIAEGIDTIYHLAAIPRNDFSKTWDEFVSVNIQGTENLLQEAKLSKVNRFVFISTVEAAGYSDGAPRKEEDTPHPCNNYGKSKLEAEKLVMNKKWGMEYVVIRLPMIYGPGTFLVVPKLFGMVRKGLYPLIGNGNTLMEFCYVGNAVHGIMLAGKIKNAKGEIFYISDAGSYTIKEVIIHIAKAMNKKIIFINIPIFIAKLIAVIWEIVAKILPFPPFIVKFSKKPFFTRDTVRWTTKSINICSIRKAVKILGFKPPFTLEEGLRLTVQDFKKRKWI